MLDPIHIEGCFGGHWRTGYLGLHDEVPNSLERWSSSNELLPPSNLSTHHRENIMKVFIISIQTLYRFCNDRTLHSPLLELRVSTLTVGCFGLSKTGLLVHLGRI